MPSRPVWQGHLRLSLVHCPVAVHKATSEARDVRFNLLNPDTHNRVKQAWKDAVTGDELARRDLVRGYEVAKDEYVVIDDEELKALKLESTKVIDIERFVDASGIDRLYWDQPYFLVPGRQDRGRALRRDPRGHGRRGQGRARAAGDGQPRADRRRRAAGGRHAADHAAQPRRGAATRTSSSRTSPR